MAVAIHNELSSEIAVALLTEERTAEERNELKEVILAVHDTLQELTADSRQGSVKEQEDKAWEARR